MHDGSVLQLNRDGLISELHQEPMVQAGVCETRPGRRGPVHPTGRASWWSEVFFQTMGPSPMDAYSMWLLSDQYAAEVQMYTQNTPVPREEVFII